MKTIYVEIGNQEYEVLLSELREAITFNFSAEYAISSEKAKKIIEDFDLWDDLRDRYYEDLISCFRRKLHEELDGARRV